jgi:hypothetical protein
MQVLVSASPIMLAPGQLEQLADLIADRLREDQAPASASSRGGLVDVHELAALLDVSTSWVYQHAHELGAVRLGSGSRPRLRFDPETARQAMCCSSSKQSHAESGSTTDDPPSPRARRRRSPDSAPKPGSILGSRPRGGS